MSESSVKRRIAIGLSLLALCASVAGCVSDMGAPAADSSGTHQLRYYGGPKSPMWPASQ